MADEPSHLTVSTQNGAHVVEFSDRKILEVSIRNIGEQLSVLVDAQDAINLILSFKEVDHISSAALGMLISIQKAVMKKQGKMLLSDLDPRIYEVFKITGLHKLFEIHDTVDQAMKHI